MFTTAEDNWNNGQSLIVGEEKSDHDHSGYRQIHLPAGAGLAKLTPGEEFGTVSAVATDSQDRVYAFQRKDPPVLVFDRQGNFLSSWGNGNFVNPHGIYIADDMIYLTDREGSVAMKYTLDGKPIQILGIHGVYSDTGCEVAGEIPPRSADLSTI